MKKFYTMSSVLCGTLALTTAFMAGMGNELCSYLMFILAILANASSSAAAAIEDKRA